MNRDNQNVTFLPEDQPVPEVEVLQDMTVNLDWLAGVARTSYHGTEDCDCDEAKNDLFVKNLLKSKHLSIFEFADVTFRLNIPIYVARQLMRYRRGTYTELSRRRVQPKKYNYPSSVFERCYNEGVDKYLRLLSQGYKKEEARAVLPVCDMTTIIVKYDLRELFHIFDERLTPYTQSDTRRVVQNMYDQLMERNPRLKRVYEEVKNELKETIDVYKKDNESLLALLSDRDATITRLMKEIAELKQTDMENKIQELAESIVINDGEVE